MARSKTELKSFNRGLVSRLGLARTDLERTGISAEVMTNWMPRNLGSMMLRPGTQYLGNTDGNNKARYIPFIYATDDAALIEITDSKVRVWVNDSLITRSAVSTVVTNGDMSSATGWTDRDGAGTQSDFVTVNGDDFMRLAGQANGPNSAIRTQEVTVNGSDQGVEHVLNLKVGEIDLADANYYGIHRVTLKVGTAEFGDDYISETVLDTGYHSLSFTPTGNFWIELSTPVNSYMLVEDCNIASAGVMELTAPWAESDLQSIRYDQSGDIIYVACDGCPPFKIERRSVTSWSVAMYEPLDGPFNNINTSDITITPAALGNQMNLTASNALFKPEWVGRLIRIVTSGQYKNQTGVTAQDTWTEAIRVTGVTNDRIFTIVISGRTDSTLTLQRSLGSDTGPWSDVTTFTADTAGTPYDDGLDNIIAWYRLGVATGDYGTDTLAFSLEYAGGSTTGDGVILSYTSSTVVLAKIYVALASTDATANWYLGSWYTGSYPTTVAFHEGRLGWFGRNKAWLSVSDAYESFEFDTIGDSGPITRTIGSGAVDNIRWALSLTRLSFGTDGREFEIRSSKDDEPLTPTNAGLKVFGTQGSGNVLGLQMDKIGLYVQRTGVRLREVSMSDANWEHQTADLTTYNPLIGQPEITHIALQRQPDNRIHCVRSDGTVALLLHDPAENVTCWVEIEMQNKFQIPTYSLAESFTNSDIDGTRAPIALNEDTSIAFIGLSDTDTVKQYTLRTAGDLDTLLETDESLDLEISTTWTAATQMVDMFVNKDGTRLYALGVTGFKGVVQYNLATAWDLSTATDSGNSLDLDADTSSNPRGCCLSDDGLHFYVGVGGSATVLRYELSTAWEIDTATKASDELTLTTAFPRGLAINSDSTELWVTTSNGALVRVYTMPTANKFTNAVLTAVKDINIDTDTDGSEALFVTPDQQDLYVTNFNAGATDTINHYQFASESLAAEIEDVVILPGADGDGEDAVYYCVKHTIGGVLGSTVRYLQKFALESECEGASISKNMDLHIEGTVTNGIMTGLSHLNNEIVSVWVDGVDAGNFSVTSNQITGVPVDGPAIVGIPYVAQFKSAKLGSLLTKQQIARLGVILDKTHYQGLRYGPDFDHLDELPLVEDGVAQAADTQHDQYDEEPFTFDGTWDTNSRLCLEAESPRNVTLLAAIIETEE